MTNTIYFVENQLKGSSHAEVQNLNLTQSDAAKYISTCGKKMCRTPGSCSAIRTF